MSSLCHSATATIPEVTSSGVWFGRGGLSLVAVVVSGVLLTSCGSSDSDSPPPPLSGWSAVRAAAAPQLALSTVFDTPYLQPIALDGWEDGICISRDGLHLYAIYAPADLLSFILAGADQSQSAQYLRGPTLGMDLHTNSVGVTTWIHGDIIHATRASTSQYFSPWRLSATARPFTSEGAVATQGTGSGTWPLFVYTSNDHAPDYKAHICLLRDVAVEPPSAAAVFLPAPVTTSTTEDNPHIERIDATNLVLFFDSDDRPGATGMHDIWYTTSVDDGATWNTPAPVTSLNTALEEQQPHLFHSSTGTWWMYFTATNPADGKLGIFRSAQVTVGNWNNWTTRELVIGAGNTEGVGEPTLTTTGDLSFVAIIKDTVHGTATNRYDGDRWFAPHLPSATVHAKPGPAAVNRLAAVRNR